MVAVGVVLPAMPLGEPAAKGHIEKGHIENDKEAMVHRVAPITILPASLIQPLQTTSLYTDAKTSITRRHHLHETVIQKSIKQAAHLAKIDKHVTPHTFRHPFATHLLQNHCDICTIADGFPRPTACFLTGGQ